MKKISVQAGRILMIACLVVFGGLMQSHAFASSASYTPLFDRSAAYSDTVKSGDYYFRHGSDWSNTLVMSDSKNGTFVATPIVSSAISNGKQACYVRNNTLYRYTYATKKETKLKKLSAKGDEYYETVTGYANRIYLNKNSFDQWKLWTYSYNLDTKVLSKVKDDCSINDRYGSYVVGVKEYRSDIAPTTLTLYRINSSTGKLTQVKVLTKHGHQGVFVDGKLYYVDYPSYKTKLMCEAVLYRYNASGSGRKKLGTFSRSNQYTEIMVGDITSKNCMVYFSGSQYRYTYSTKKLKKL
ncbi:MAG: hypothetical protein ACI4PM_06580 [Butyricicoccus sp.]